MNATFYRPERVKSTLRVGASESCPEVIPEVSEPGESCKSQIKKVN